MPGTKRQRDREVPETAQAALRFVRALGRRIADGDPDALTYFRELEETINASRAEAVTGLRAQGHSDSFIGEALGVTQQAVSKRWPRRATCERSTSS